MANAIEFGGCEWKVKTGARGPGKNALKAENIRCQGGAVTLSVASEIYLPESLGYGKYRFVVECGWYEVSPPSIAGLSLFADEERSISIALDHRGASYSSAGKPTFVPGKVVGEHAHVIDWSPRGVEFHMDGKRRASHKSPSFLPGAERVHVRIWTETPAASSASLVLRDFKFTKMVS